MLQAATHSQRRQGRTYMGWILTSVISLSAIWCTSWLPKHTHGPEHVRFVKCDKIAILVRRWHFRCEVTNSDQFLKGEFLNSIEASLNTVGSGSPILRKEGGSGVWLMGLSGLIVMLLFPLKRPICLSRLKHALTRYDSRCDWRLGYFRPGWLTLWWLVTGG